MKEDVRSTEELVDAALLEREQNSSFDACPALAALHARGNREVFDTALVLFRFPEPRRRALGAEILGQLGVPLRAFPDECCDALLALLRREVDTTVLIATVFALGHLGNRRCEPDLISLRDHPDEDVRHGVAFALAGTTPSAAVRALLQLMDDPYAMARDWATTSIGQTVSVDGPEIRAALLRRAEDGDEITRAEALHGLARRQDERAIPDLLAELSLPREHRTLFADAAKTYLGIDEDSVIDSDTLIAALEARHRRPCDF
jgi:HEAT repeat protein